MRNATIILTVLFFALAQPNLADAAKVKKANVSNKANKKTKKSNLKSKAKSSKKSKTSKKAESKKTDGSTLQFGKKSSKKVKETSPLKMSKGDKARMAKLEGKKNLSTKQKTELKALKKQAKQVKKAQKQAKLETQLAANTAPTGNKADATVTPFTAKEARKALRTETKKYREEAAGYRKASKAQRKGGEFSRASVRILLGREALKDANQKVAEFKASGNAKGFRGQFALFVAKASNKLASIKLNFQTRALKRSIKGRFGIGGIAKARAKKGDAVGVADAMRALKSLEKPGGPGPLGVLKSEVFKAAVMKKLRSGAKLQAQNGNHEAVIQAIELTGMIGNAKSQQKTNAALLKTSLKTAKKYAQGGHLDLAMHALDLTMQISQQTGQTVDKAKLDKIANTANKKAIKTFIREAKQQYKHGQLDGAAYSLARAQNIAAKPEFKMPSTWSVTTKVGRTNASLTKKLGNRVDIAKQEIQMAEAQGRGETTVKDLKDKVASAQGPTARERATGQAN